MERISLFLKTDLLRKASPRIEGLMFLNFFSQTKYGTIRFLFTTAVHNGWHQQAMNVKAALSNADLEQKIFVSQPEKFEDKQNLRKVYKLRRALYALKQSLRQRF